MEEEKAAAYYEELTRKGGGAARFKQGLGFSSATTASDDPPSRGSALASSSSFLSNFVRASSPTKEKEVDKRTRLENIQNKLKKKEPTSSIEAPSEKARVGDRDRRRSRSRDREIRSNRSRSRSRERRRRSRSRSRSRERRRRRSGGGSDEDSDRSRRRYRSSSRDRRRKRNREGRSRRRSRSRSYSDGDRRYGRNKGRSRSRSRSCSPRHRRKSERGKEGDGKERRTVKKMGNDSVDYAKLIDGYDNMTPAERVKAKMKLQLTQTAEKDTKIGSGSQWERFDFDNDAPVDDKEIEAADDDIALVKHIGQSFRFTSLETKREDEIKNAHDEAMFGVPAPIPSYTLENGEEGGSENENENKESTNDDDPASSLISEKVLWKQQGSWRDRARRKVG